MKKTIILLVIFLTSAVFSYYLVNNALSQNSENTAIERIVEPQEPNIWKNQWDIYKTIYLAWGCFWCIEWAFDTKPWIISAVSGYAWWKQSTANYEDISTGKTAHRETVKVTYNPVELTLENVLDTFFWYIDPYDTGWQFADRWYQYTTAIFYKDEEEKQKLLEYINSHDFEDNLATKFIQISSFYEAEEHHQDYAQKKSGNYERYFKWSGRKDYVNENKDKYK